MQRYETSFEVPCNVHLQYKALQILCNLLFHHIEKDFPALTVLNEIAVTICSIYNCRGFVCSFCCFVQKCKFPARPISITTIIKIRMMIFLLISLQDFIKDLVICAKKFNLSKFEFYESVHCGNCLYNICASSPSRFPTECVDAAFLP